MFDFITVVTHRGEVALTWAPDTPLDRDTVYREVDRLFGPDRFTHTIVNGGELTIRLDR